MSANRPQLVAAFAAVYIIWGSTYLAIRFAIETLPPFLMAGVRFVIAGAAMYTWARLRGAPRPNRVHWRSAIVIGVLLLVGGNGGVVWSEQFIPSGVAAVVVALVPIWIATVDWARPGGERPAALTVAGLLAGFAGTAVLVAPVEIAGLRSSLDSRAVLVVVGASVSWAAGSVYSRYAPMVASPITSTGMKMLAGGAVLIGVGTASGEWTALDPTTISIRSLAAMAYLIVFGAIVAFTAYLWLLKNATLAAASTYAYVNPVVAVLLGWALAGEAVTVRLFTAMLVIIAAVVAITRRAAVRPPSLPPGSTSTNDAAFPAVGYPDMT